MYRNNYYQYRNMNNGDRFFGGFIGPFILGGITGGLIANNRPYNYNSYPVFIPYYPSYPYSQYNQYYY